MMKDGFEEPELLEPTNSTQCMEHKLINDCIKINADLDKTETDEYC